MSNDLPDCAAVAHSILADAMRDTMARVTQSDPGDWLPGETDAQRHLRLVRAETARVQQSRPSSWPSLPEPDPARVAELERAHERNRALVCEAAAIAAGRSDKLATRAHLDALFAWFEVDPESECCSRCGNDEKQGGFEPATFHMEAQPTGIDYCTRCNRAWEPAYWPESEEIREEMR